MQQAASLADDDDVIRPVPGYHHHHHHHQRRAPPPPPIAPSVPPPDPRLRGAAFGHVGPTVLQTPRYIECSLLMHTWNGREVLMDAGAGAIPLATVALDYDAYLGLALAEPARVPTTVSARVLHVNPRMRRSPELQLQAFRHHVAQLLQQEEAAAAARRQQQARVAPVSAAPAVVPPPTPAEDEAEDEVVLAELDPDASPIPSPPPPPPPPPPPRAESAPAVPAQLVPDDGDDAWSEADDAWSEADDDVRDATYVPAAAAAAVTARVPAEPRRGRKRPRIRDSELRELQALGYEFLEDRRERRKRLRREG